MQVLDAAGIHNPKSQMTNFPIKKQQKSSSNMDRNAIDAMCTDIDRNKYAKITILSDIC